MRLHQGDRKLWLEIVKIAPFSTTFSLGGSLGLYLALDGIIRKFDFYAISRNRSNVTSRK